MSGYEHETKYDGDGYASIHVQNRLELCNIIIDINVTDVIIRLSCGYI